MKIGIIGGTFNPIHLAHLRIAEEVRERFGLERVLFVPAATPPHKPLAGDLPFAGRFDMVRLAITDNPAFA
ncbi:MAG: adenylyltransferase/cytidyltransferase family protein, partial [Geobacteraceae bacterium]